MKKYLVLFVLLMLMGSFLVTSLHTTATPQDDDNNNGDDDHNSSNNNDDDNNHTDNNNHDEDNGSSSDENEQSRAVHIEKSDHKIQIEAEKRTGNRKDKVEAEIKAEDGHLKIEFRYKTKVNSTKTDLKLKVKFREIIEYVDNGTPNNGYQLGEEIFRYHIGKAGWKPFNYTVQTINGTNMHVMSITTTDGVFTAIFRVSEKLISLNNTKITPNEIKIDIRIVNFPYTSNASSLALKTKIESKFKYKVENETHDEQEGRAANETEVRIGGTDALQGFFSWAEMATADGNQIPVLHSNLTEASHEEHDLEEGETSYMTFFSFIATTPKDIYWDPKIGIAVSTALQNNILANLTPGFEALSFLLVLALIMPLIQYRRRKQYK